MKVRRTARPSKKGLMAIAITLATAGLLALFAGAAGFDSVAVLTNRGICEEPSGGTVQCLLGTLAPGESATVQVKVVATSPGTLSDTASAFATEPDPDLSNNSASVRTTILGQTAPPQTADLSVRKRTLRSRISVGTPFAYEIVVKNHGPIGATNVVINDFLPLTVNFVSASGAACIGTAGISVVNCSIATLPAGASAIITIVGEPTSVGPIVNRATVSADQPDPDLTNNEDLITTNVVQRSVDLRVEKTGVPNPATVGDEITYTIIVTNDGPDAANDVTLTDDILGGN